jgi:hypothetical protein
LASSGFVLILGHYTDFYSPPRIFIQRPYKLVASADARVLYKGF